MPTATKTRQTAKRPAAKKGPARAKAPAKQEKVSAREAAKIILTEAKRPMHYREIAEQAVARNLIAVRGSSRRKPKLDATIKTVRSFLAGSVNEKGSEFVRVDSGIFDLAKRPKPKKKA